MTSSTPTPCRFLTADLADTADGDAVLELSASIRPARAARDEAVRLAEVAAVRDEVQRVLAWCEARHPGDHGPREDGHAWYHDLQVADEAGGWHTVSLTIIGDGGLIAALAARFFPDTDG